MIRKILFLSLFIGCTTNSSNRVADLDQVYQGAGVEQHFLTALPDWANFSRAGACKRDTSIRYLNFETLYQNYSLDYESLVQLQYMFNVKSAEMKEQQGKESLFTTEVNKIFYNSYQLILGGDKQFIAPEFNRVHLVWIDPVLKDNKLLKKFKQLMKSSQMEKGHPVLVSTCLSHRSLSEFILEHNLEQMGTKGISSELFNIYSEKELKPVTSFRLNFSEILKNKKLIFYAPWFPSEFSGTFLKKNY